jgi:ABC-2 type transport system ATP-binding protein
VTAIPATAAIEARGLQKSYGARRVLRGVDLEVRRGEVYCLLGRNGAGKTTVVEILEGFTRATAGTVSVLGHDPAGQPRDLRLRIGVVLQEGGLPRHLRVAELLNAWRWYYPAPRPLADLLEVVGLRDESRSPVRRLSGGQRRRLDFALALAGDPDLIFLDEPTTGFDPEARQRCWAAIDNLRALGKTVLLTTHYLEEAERLADRVAILAAGRIQVAAPPRVLARQSGVPTRISFQVPERVSRGEVSLPEGLGLTLTDGRAGAAAEPVSAVLRALLDWADRNDLGELEELEVAPPGLQDAFRRLAAPDHAGPR